MGADLYINSIYNIQRQQYEPKFNHWVSVRENYKNAGKTKAVKKAQKQVWKYYDKMNGDEGYFRDSYNDSNLLWRFELSWWKDVGEKLINKEGNLGLDKIKQFRQMLSENEALFEANLEKMELVGDETREDIKAYFHHKYTQLKKFLNRALQLNEHIYCSI